MQLLSPVQIGDLKLKNRVVMAPLTRVRADAGHVPGELIADHYRQRAGAGLIVSEATQVAADARAFGMEPGIHSAEQIAGWRRVTDAVHRAGGLIALQLWHPGRATHPALNGGVQPVSSSNKAIQGDEIRTPEGVKAYPVPRPLRLDEIPGIVGLFRRGAENAKAAGFDAVEVHGAHGYLLDQFLRDGVNDRTDRYGGSLENRARLLLEVVDEAIAVFGSGRVGLRLSPYIAYNDMRDSNVPALVAYVAAELERRKAAYLHMRHVTADAAPELELARIVRENFRGAYIRNGGFTRESGEADIVAGRADAIAYGMPFIANPDLPERFARNAPLNAVRTDKLYASGPEGYNDYPTLAA